MRRAKLQGLGALAPDMLVQYRRNTSYSCAFENASLVSSDHLSKRHCPFLSM